MNSTACRGAVRFRAGAIPSCTRITKTNSISHEDLDFFSSQLARTWNSNSVLFGLALQATCPAHEYAQEHVSTTRTLSCAEYARPLKSFHLRKVKSALESAHTPQCLFFKLCAGWIGILRPVNGLFGIFLILRTWDLAGRVNKRPKIEINEPAATHSKQALLASIGICTTISQFCFHPSFQNHQTYGTLRNLHVRGWVQRGRTCMWPTHI